MGIQEHCRFGLSGDIDDRIGQPRAHAFEAKAKRWAI